MTKKDYYDVLSVPRNASDADVKKAYRRLAMKHHPDRTSNNPESEEKFKEAKEAYDILSDQRKRTAYDQFGHAAVDNSAAGGGGAGAGFGTGGSFSDIFGEVFGDIFSGSGQQSRGRNYRGSDLRYNLELNLEDAVRGSTVKIKVPSHVQCKTCNGTGARKGTKPTNCTTCGGHGQVRMQQGFFSLQQTCPRCHGSGTIISEPCSTCHGQGRTQENKTLSVKIPAGVDNGDRIRLANEGEAAQMGGTPGDLYVQISVRDHAIFVRDGNDLYCEVPISIVTAALGGELEVPTLEHRVKLKIPAETQTNKVFRMRGKGVKSVRGSGVGDLLCRVVVETPVRLTPKQRDLLSEFDKTTHNTGKKHSPKAHSWLGGVKKFFEEMKF